MANVAGDAGIHSREEAGAVTSATASSPRAPSGVEIEHANRELVGAPAEEILRWGVEHFAPGTLGLISAFGPGSAVLIHLLSEIEPEIPVVFVDTLHHFPETLAHVERVRERYGLDLRVYRPEESLEAFEAKYGERLWDRDVDRYQEVSKIEPFRRGTDPLAGWFTGRRKDQANTRADLPIVEAGDKIRINPLIDWTRGGVWKFILEHDLPYNPLHDQGYTSIGDAPLTTPVGAGEDERAGRWRGTGKTECGIHLI